MLQSRAGSCSCSLYGFKAVVSETWDFLISGCGSGGRVGHLAVRKAVDQSLNSPVHISDWKLKLQSILFITLLICVYVYIFFLFAFCSYCQAVETLHTVSPVWKIEESNYYFSLFVDYLYKGTLNFPSLSLPVFYFPPTFTYILKCHSDSFFYLLARGNCSICFLFISNNMLPVLFLLFISFEGTGKHISSI